MAASISHYLTTASNILVVLPKENVSFVIFLSLQLTAALFLVELRWPVAHKFVDITIILA